MRVGAIFCVVDASYPQERIELQLDILRPRIVLIAHEGISAAYSPSANLQRTGWANLCDMLHHAPINNFVAHVRRPGDLAYFLFTSGSTGLPKCLAFSLEPLKRFVDWHISTFGLTRDDRFSMLSGVAHDPVLRDIFTPLALGATLVIPTNTELNEPGALRHFMQASKITVAHLTPPMGQLLLAGSSDAPELHHLRHLFWGGDRLVGSLVRQVMAIAPNAEQTNFYGSTETPQAATYHRCALPPDGDQIPIGKGAVNNRVDVLDADGRPTEGDAQGEIAISSQELAIGLVEGGRIISASSSERQVRGEQTHLTGDFGHRTANGEIAIDGRADDQIKIRGYRVDPAEVAFQLNEHPSVDAAVALPVRNDGPPRINAFVAAKDHRDELETELMQFLKSRLPDYMMPSRIWIVGDAIPLLPNAKPDRAALAEFARSAAARQREELPFAPDDRSSSTLNSLTERWSRLLQRDRIDPDASFATLGGDSLNYVQAYMELEDVVGTVPDGWPEMSLRELAALANSSATGFTTRIESVIALRALFITLIVALHAGLLGFGDGATTPLFVVSGYLFAKSQWEAMFDRSMAGRLLKPLGNLLPLTALFTWATVIFGLVLRHPIPWSNVLLSADLVDHPNYVGMIRDEGIYWYLHSLIKVILLVYAIQFVFGGRLTRRSSQYAFVLGICVVTFALMLVLPVVLLDDAANLPAHGLSVFQTSPLRTLPLFYLGVCLSIPLGGWRKTGAISVVFLVCWLSAYTFGMMNAIYLGLVVACIIYVPTITVPKITSRWIASIAAASFYIYLVHTWIDKPWHILHHGVRTQGDIYSWLMTASGLAAGIGLMHLMRASDRYLERLRRTTDLRALFDHSGSS